MRNGDIVATANEMSASFLKTAQLDIAQHQASFGLLAIRLLALLRCPMTKPEALQKEIYTMIEGYQSPSHLLYHGQIWLSIVAVSESLRHSNTYVSVLHIITIQEQIVRESTLLGRNIGLGTLMAYEARYTEQLHQRQMAETLAGLGKKSGFA